MKSHTKNATNGPDPDVLDSLRVQLQSLENGQRHTERSADCVTSGCDALDQMLPAGGFTPGQLVEWIVENGGNGGSTLAFTVARAAVQTHDKALVVIDRPQSRDHAAAFYPPAAAELGIDLRRLIVLRPNSAADEIWAIDQALRCPSVGAVWAWLPKLNSRDFRRFQLAAEEGGSIGLLMRPSHTRGQPTWADIQLLVETRPSTSPIQQLTRSAPVNGSTENGSGRCPSQPTRRRRWQVTLLRCRGGVAGKQLLLELDETNGMLTERILNSSRQTKRDISSGAVDYEKSPLPLAAELANPTSRPGNHPPPIHRKPKNRNSA